MQQRISPNEKPRSNDVNINAYPSVLDDMRQQFKECLAKKIKKTEVARKELQATSQPCTNPTSSGASWTDTAKDAGAALKSAWESVNRTRKDIRRAIFGF